MKELEMTAKEAASLCHTLGFIAQVELDGEIGLKFWKHTKTFREDVECLIHTEPSWQNFDPEGEEISIVG